jgi:hypothetical protein
VRIHIAFRSVREHADPLIPHENADDRWIGTDSVEPAICGGDIIAGVHAEIAKHYEMAGVDNWVGQRRTLLTGDLEIDAFLDLIDGGVRDSLSVTADSLTRDFDDNVLKEHAFADPRRCYHYAIENSNDGVISFSAAYEGMRVFIIRKNAIARVINNLRTEVVEMSAGLYDDAKRRRGRPLSQNATTE